MKLVVRGLFAFFRIHYWLIRFVRWPGLSAVCRQAYWSARLKNLGDSAIIHPWVVIHQPGSVSIGDRTSISEFVHIWGGGGVDIGNDSLVASHVAIISVSHDPDGSIVRETKLAKPVTIEDNVWVGAGAVLLPGIRLGSGSVIGAGAVVTKNVSPGSIVAGNPAAVLRLRRAPKS